METVERRLAALLSADAVGYTRLMAQDELATVRAIGACRELIARLVGEHRGRVVDAPGDNLLAEFSQRARGGALRDRGAGRLSASATTMRPRTGACRSGSVCIWGT